MEKLIQVTKMSFSAMLAYLFGGFDGLMQMLCILMAVDYISGILVATVFRKSTKSESGTLKSSVAVKGIVRKICCLLLVITITRLGENLGDQNFCRNTAIMFFSANEGISILENMGLMGVRYPHWLSKSLEVLLDNSENR